MFYFRLDDFLVHSSSWCSGERVERKNKIVNESSYIREMVIFFIFFSLIFFLSYIAHITIFTERIQNIMELFRYVVHTNRYDTRNVQRDFYIRIFRVVTFNIFLKRRAKKKKAKIERE